MDMFSAEIFSKPEMLQLVGDLFGPQYPDLFAEFKRLMHTGGPALLSNIGAPAGSGQGDAMALTTDMWYSTPLAEVDFSQCRKCTPSYRALPKVCA